ncbi:MAG TPA: FAD-dependent oxidoreductase [Anaerovoracaceae bacterium]|nr:FAD-dependent oxidoreductase [Anaerovoracaceae bacterium]
MEKTIVIIGGVAGGADIAAGLRKLDENAHIILFEKDEYSSYADCGSPYYSGDGMKEREELPVTTPAIMKDRFHIDIRIKNEVIEIDRSYKTVLIKSRKTDKTYLQPYDILVLL